jgi:chromosomal replication initiation ATPase DnaA
VTATERRVGAVLYLVCRQLDVDAETVMRSTRRERSVARARGLAMSLCVKVFRMSTTEVGQHFKRNHSTVIHAGRVHATTPMFERMADQLRAAYPAG